MDKQDNEKLNDNLIWLSDDQPCHNQNQIYCPVDGIFITNNEWRESNNHSNL